jgi:CubicO group peptidase (beta-lactamase class C family)
MKKIICIIILTILVGTSVLPVSGIVIENKILEIERLNISIKTADIDEEIQNLMKFGRVPSLSTCIIKDDVIVWSNAYGFADKSQQISATIDTNYMVASISKTFIATAILQLNEQGYFDLDDGVNDYLPFEVNNPNFPDDPITIRMLLAHQSSFSYNLPLSIYVTEDEFIYRQIFVWYHMKDLFKSDFFDEEFYPWIKDIMTQDGIHYNPGF